MRGPMKGNLFARSVFFFFIPKDIGMERTLFGGEKLIIRGNISMATGDGRDTWDVTKDFGEAFSLRMCRRSEIVVKCFGRWAGMCASGNILDVEILFERVFYSRVSIPALFA